MNEEAGSTVRKRTRILVAVTALARVLTTCVAADGASMPTVDPKRDWRAYEAGKPVRTQKFRPPGKAYCEGSAGFKLRDGRYAGSFTVANREGGRDFRLMILFSEDPEFPEDKTRVWWPEPPGNGPPESNYGGLMYHPDGTLYCCYGYNHRKVTHAPGGASVRGDSFGKAWRLSTDHGRTWSKRYLMKLPDKAIDRENALVRTGRCRDASRVATWPRPEGAPRSKAFVVTVEGTRVPLYRHLNANWGTFDFAGGPVRASVRINRRAGSATVLPSRLVSNVVFDAGDSTVTFTIFEPDSFLTVLPNGHYDRPALHLFANGPENDPIRGPRENVIYFGPGYHEPAGGVVRIESGQTLYLAGGAYVNARIVARNATNIAIRGRGVVTQNDSLLRKGRHGHGLYLRNCANVRLAGFIENKQQQGWSACMDLCSNVTIRAVKIVTDAVPCTDGLNQRCGRDVTYRRCFFRTGDDCIAIKGFHRDKEYWKLPPNERILIEDCILFTRHNGCISFGTETATSGYRDITVRNCDFLYQRGANSKGWKAAIAIKMKFGTDIRDILFDDIRLGPHSQLVSLLIAPVIWRRGNLARPGDIHHITFRNVTTSHSRRHDITLRGYDARHVIRDVTFENLRVRGRLIERPNDPIFLHNEYASFSCQGHNSTDLSQSIVSPDRVTARSKNWAANWKRICNDSVSDGEAFGADGNPVWIEFTLDEPTRIESVRVYNDGSGPHCLASWQVSCRTDGTWRDVTGTRSARPGWNPVGIDNVRTTALRLTLNPPRGDKVGCYEFACHGKPTSEEE